MPENVGRPCAKGSHDSSKCVLSKLILIQLHLALCLSDAVVNAGTQTCIKIDGWKKKCLVLTNVLTWCAVFM